MNWSIIGFIVLIWLIIIAFGMMIYFEYVDPLLRQAQWRKEQENESSTVTSDGYPAVTWVLEAKVKELTDEEIDEVYSEYRTKGYKTLARAYLRKAQEK